MHPFTGIFMIEGFILYFLLLLTMKYLHKKRRIYLVVIFGVSAIIYSSIGLYIAAHTRSIRNQEFENWAKVNQIHYINGDANFKVSGWKTYDSIMHGSVKYREVLE